ncbi:MAG: hypothetical protein MZU91_13250 [Desulfosudis oleivorans]|nr:hypothetical protein [Desulfosudis oleivorans]
MNKGTTFAIYAGFTMMAAAILILGIDLGPSGLLSEDAIAQVMGPITTGKYLKRTDKDRFEC